MKPEFVAWGVAAAALLYAAYVGLRGLGYFGRPERPEKLIGKEVRLSGVEGLAETTLPSARVLSFDGSSYLLELAADVMIGTENVKNVRVSARHKGFSVSSTKKWGLRAVNGQTPAGQGFIACLNLN
jgi:hypothetical protein